MASRLTATAAGWSSWAPSAAAPGRRVAGSGKAELWVVTLADRVQAVDVAAGGRAAWRARKFDTHLVRIVRKA